MLDLDQTQVVAVEQARSRRIAQLEYPKGSGAIRTLPEVDRIEWFGLATAQLG